MKNRVDYVFLSIVIVLSLFGLLMLYEASAIYSNVNFGGKYHFLVLQIGWLFIGAIGAYFMSRVDLEILKKYSPWIMGFSLFLLLLVLVPSIFSPPVYGARRWLIINPAPIPQIPGLGRLSFQPSEFAKLAGIIFTASFLSSKKILEESAVKLSIKFTLVVVVVCGLIFLQPNFTTSFIVGVVLIYRKYGILSFIIYSLLVTPLQPSA